MESIGEVIGPVEETPEESNEKPPGTLALPPPEPISNAEESEPPAVNS